MPAAPGGVCAVFQEWEPVLRKATAQADEVAPRAPEVAPNDVRRSVRRLAATIRVNLHVQRLQRTWTLQHLSSRTGIEVKRLRAFEQGCEFPTPDAFEKLERVLGTKIQV